MGEPYSVKKSRKATLRQELWERENGLCFYCQKPVAIDASHLDHVIAKSRGGPHGSTNRVLSCARCNSIKGALSLGDWRNKVEARLEKAKSDAIYFAAIQESFGRLY